MSLIQPNRQEVQIAIERALAPFCLDNYADGVMDSLDTVVDFAGENDDD